MLNQHGMTIEQRRQPHFKVLIISLNFLELYSISFLIFSLSTSMIFHCEETQMQRGLGEGVGVSDSHQLPEAS